MTMVTVQQVDFGSAAAVRLLALLNAHWSDLTHLETERDGMEIPQPFVAQEGNCVVGGGCFSRYTRPGGSDPVVWLNALYVVPSHRGRGIASQLLRDCIRVAPQLYALTDIPALYTQLGWKILSTDSDGIVVGWNHCV